jgi:hypothetical protein
MRGLYIAGLVLIDLVVLLLGALVSAFTEVDEDSALASVRTLPTLLLVLPGFFLVRAQLSRAGGIAGFLEGRTRSRLLWTAGGMGAAGAAILVTLAALFDGPVSLALVTSALGGLGIVYAVLVGDRVARRRADAASDDAPEQERPAPEAPDAAPASSPAPTAAPRIGVLLVVGVPVVAGVICFLLLSAFRHDREGLARGPQIFQ